LDNGDLEPVHANRSVEISFVAKIGGDEAEKFVLLLCVTSLLGKLESGAMRTARLEQSARRGETTGETSKWSDSEFWVPRGQREFSCLVDSG
jgi:hypothetical protein